MLGNWFICQIDFFNQACRVQSFNYLTCDYMCYMCQTLGIGKGKREKKNMDRSSARIKSQLSHLWPSFGFKLMIGSSSAPPPAVCVCVSEGWWQVWALWQVHMCGMSGIAGGPHGGPTLALKLPGPAWKLRMPAWPHISATQPLYPSLPSVLKHYTPSISSVPHYSLVLQQNTTAFQPSSF